jgi:hypothetical protein
MHDLVSRYWFHDACITELTRRNTYGPSHRPSTATVTMQLMPKPGDQAWVTLDLHLLDVRDQRVLGYCWVLMDAPHIARDETGLLHIDLDTDEPELPRTIEKMKQESALYLCAKEIYWAETGPATDM